MRIGIKVSPLTVLRAGIPNYIHNLLSALGKVDRSNEYFLYTGRPLPMELDLPDNFRLTTVSFPSPRLQLWYQIGLPLRMKRDRLHLFHDPVYPLPFHLPVPGVITVHDLSNYTDPGVHSFRAAMAGKLFPHHLRKARRIITVSRYTASRLRDIFPWTEDRIRVIHHGVSENFKRVEDDGVLGSAAERFGLPSRFMLFLGTLEPRKNLDRLLAAFAECAGEVPHSLVIAGGLGWKYEKLLHRISSHPVAERIHLTGFVEEEHLPALLSMAEFLVYPSLLEGFGLPILEAMACGTPVLTSDTSSMPEIAGDAAYLVNPASVESIAGGLRRMAADEGLREELTRRGRVRASGFSWRETAKQTLEVYRSAAD
ncbi:MAG: glycosyltransferase family 1 protein [Candidatus Aegiribacteria sp.]